MKFKLPVILLFSIINISFTGIETDSLYLELMRKDINEMSDREYDYFMKMKEKYETKAEEQQPKPEPPSVQVVLKEEDNSKITDTFLYNARKKSLGTALGLEALGAGMIYAENYKVGIPMLFAENGLLITGALLTLDDPDIAMWMFVGGLALKALNTIFTITSVNDFNKNLLMDLRSGKNILMEFQKAKEEKSRNWRFEINPGFTPLMLKKSKLTESSLYMLNGDLGLIYKYQHYLGLSSNFSSEIIDEGVITSCGDSPKCLEYPLTPYQNPPEFSRYFGTPLV